MLEVLQRDVGAVVIGRNEGARLLKCLHGLQERVAGVVYVDSGSTDDSVNMALALDAYVVELDLALPFTAARARNEGFKKLSVLFSQLKYVQFVDGDCEIVAGWLEKAVNFLEQNEDFAVVCGRRRERFPDQSIYNRLCDMEWNTPVGEAKACGGDAMMRVTAFRQVEGFRADLIAGEEPELCIRLRHQGWKIWRLNAEMTLHDAAILRFGQWWRRSVRAGYAFARGAHLHGKPPERHWVRETLSAIVWGFGLPIIVVVLLVFSQFWGLVLLGLYPIQVMRIYSQMDGSLVGRGWYAYLLVVGKFAEMMGVIRFVTEGLVNRKSRLIEYK